MKMICFLNIPFGEYVSPVQIVGKMIVQKREEEVRWWHIGLLWYRWSIKLKYANVSRAIVVVFTLNDFSDKYVI